MSHQEIVTQNTSSIALNLNLIPLSKLRPAAANVRKVAGQSIEALASSIERIGLLQNLTVTLASDGKHYEVVAGGRRLAALNLLAKSKKIAKNFEVPCSVVADSSARTASLTENVQREAMHPADEYEAFAALVAEGRSIEDIAADFAVTPLVVQRRLKLANVSPRLIADYRTGGVTLEQLMALAITDDHAAQEHAFYDGAEWSRQPHALRKRLTESEVEAHLNPLAKFVGVEAYQAAGGQIRRDLFAEGEKGVYLSDVALLEKLAQEKLAVVAEDVKAEGWKWVDVSPGIPDSDLYALTRAKREHREPTAEEASQIEALKAQIQKLDDEMEAIADSDESGEDEEKQEQYNALDEKKDELEEQLETLEDGLMMFSDRIKALTGAIVRISRGEVEIHRGLFRDADAKAFQKQEREQQAAQEQPGEAGTESAAIAMSDRLVQRLSAHRTAALQLEFAKHPHVALAAVVHGMVQRVLQDRIHWHDLPVRFNLTLKGSMESIAPDVPESPAVLALQELQKTANVSLPHDNAELFNTLLAMEQGELVNLLAVCSAATVDVVVSGSWSVKPGAELAQAVGLDMSQWWKPTAESYFQHLSKAAILDAVKEFAPAEIDRLAKLKKTEIASEAERLVTGTGWMPEVFRKQA